MSSLVVGVSHGRLRCSFLLCSSLKHRIHRTQQHFTAHSRYTEADSCGLILTHDGSTVRSSADTKVGQCIILKSAVGGIDRPTAPEDALTVIAGSSTSNLRTLLELLAKGHSLQFRALTGASFGQRRCLLATHWSHRLVSLMACVGPREALWLFVSQ